MGFVRALSSVIVFQYYTTCEDRRSQSECSAAARVAGLVPEMRCCGSGREPVDCMPSSRSRCTWITRPGEWRAMACLGASKVSGSRVGSGSSHFRRPLSMLLERFAFRSFGRTSSATEPLRRSATPGSPARSRRSGSFGTMPPRGWARTGAGLSAWFGGIVHLRTRHCKRLNEIVRA